MSTALDRLVAALHPLDVDALRLALQDELATTVEALLLYGSRARGEAHANSDWDVLAVAAAARPAGVRRRWDGVDLDVDVKTRADLDAAGPDLVYLTPGRILWDPDGYLAALTDRLEARRAAGPPPLDPAERERWLAWLHRMLRRIEGNLDADPILAAYQMSWLHMELLNLYFQDRALWTRGPRHALRWLGENDSETYAAYRDFAEATEAATRAACLERMVGRTMRA